MAIEPKEIFEYLGIDPVEKFEDFRTKFEPVYIRKNSIKDDKEFQQSLVQPLMGKIAQITTQNLVKELKSEGIEFESGEIKELKESPIEDVFNKGVAKLKTYYTSKIAELESKAGSGSDEKVKEYQTKFEKLQAKYEQEHNLFEQTKQSFEQERQSFANEKKGIKMQSKVGDAFKSIKWKTGASEIEKKGFLSLVNEKYKIDLDEQDELFIADSKGQRIPHPKKNGEFKNIHEILEEEGRAAGVWEGNPIADRAKPQRPVHQQGQIQQPAFTGAPTGRPRVLSPAAQANEGK